MYACVCYSSLFKSIVCINNSGLYLAPVCPTWPLDTALLVPKFDDCSLSVTGDTKIYQNDGRMIMTPPVREKECQMASFRKALATV